MWIGTHPVMLLCLSMGAYGVFGRAKFTIDFANDVARCLSNKLSAAFMRRL